MTAVNGPSSSDVAKDFASINPNNNPNTQLQQKPDAAREVIQKALVNTNELNNSKTNKEEQKSSLSVTTRVRNWTSNVPEDTSESQTRPKGTHVAERVRKINEQEGQPKKPFPHPKLNIDDHPKTDVAAKVREINGRDQRTFPYRLNFADRRPNKG